MKKISIVMVVEDKADDVKLSEILSRNAKEFEMQVVYDYKKEVENEDEVCNVVSVEYGYDN